MGLGIEKNYDYRNDRKTTGTYAAAKITKPILHLASAENPNPTSVAISESEGTPVQTTHVFKKWSELKHEYDEINNLPTDEAKIVRWHKDNAGLNPKKYVVVDKTSCKLKVYSADGKVLESFEVGIGKQKGDDFAKTDRQMTSAGIYSVLGKAKVKGGYSEYSITTERGSTGISIHEFPSGHPEMSRKMYNGNLNDNRFTGGDVNLLPTDFKEMEKYIKSGTEVYILPEDSNNKIVAKDGQLNFVQQQFTGQVLTSKKPTLSHQIKIDLNTSTVQTDVMKDFTRTLAGKKADLMDKLDIDNDTYNDIASLILGIAGQESKFGESSKYWLKEHCNWFVSLVKLVKGKKSTNSRGLTQMKLGEYKDPDTKRLLKEYGINEDNIEKPQNSAIATMIVLTGMYKNELPGLRDKMKTEKVSTEAGLLYLWNGKKKQITEGKATPDKNIYIQHVRKFLDGNFTVKEVVEKPKEKK